jgi:hypothetical protein
MEVEVEVEKEIEIGREGRANGYSTFICNNRLENELSKYSTVQYSARTAQGR